LVIIDEINAVMLSIRDFFKNIKNCGNTLQYGCTNKRLTNAQIILN